LTSLPWFARSGRTIVHGAPEGCDAFIIARAARSLADQGRTVLHVARDDARMATLADCIAVAAPEIDVIQFPAWDCLPYDRVSPNGPLVSRRIDALGRIAAGKATTQQPRVVITTVAALLQRVPSRAVIGPAFKPLVVGDKAPLPELLRFFTDNGYQRVDTVREPGEFAVRGGIVDVFPTGMAEPVRLDLFGDVLDGVRDFDPMTQRSTGTRKSVAFRPVSELRLDADSIERFRNGYRGRFGPQSANDPLYEAISAGRRHMGMEHWLPLFDDRLETLFDHLPDAPISLDSQAEEGVAARFELITDYYEARLSMIGVDRDGAPYRPLPPEMLYLTGAELADAFERLPIGAFTSSAFVDGPNRIDAGGRLGPTFADVRNNPDLNLFDAVRDHATAMQRDGRRVVIASQSAGSRDRIQHLLKEHGASGAVSAETWPEVEKASRTAIACVVMPLERGFLSDGLALVTEADILGDRLIRTTRKKRAADYISEAGSLSDGDLVVHVEHGVGRYDGLITVEVGGAPHDCLRVVYAGGDKLFVPVENIDILSRFGADDGVVQLDKLGGLAWQARKSRVKQRIRDIAERLIRVAAERLLREGQVLSPPEGSYDEFAARFPFAETDDQLRAIEETLADMASGRPMDRLICGDVGFGKTEVAMRAAFVAAMSGQQVAVVVPTTLLARQHFRTFSDRFQGLPVRVEQLSRLIPAKQASQIKKDVADGKVEILVGTHAVLAKSIAFKDLGLLVVDEEQHFGVGQKERLKELKTDVHVLTLTATPIPRTLQLALTGVRDMSVIATPPVDRLAVRTFVLPYDPVVIREAILREHFRGGQMFYVCPRLEDLDDLAARVRKLVPEIKIVIAHGRMAAQQLEEVMTAFCDGSYDMLISTNIVESGLDIPKANTMLIHRADMFGLAQLYQLRGRIGRSKTRAYAYLTLPPDRVPTEAAMKRLEVMQTLDQLGAGFKLASHDLDIRGAGNLLGDEQSGQIREVGIELYQQLLEEAVQLAKAGGAPSDAPAPDSWTPQISIGMPVLIPEGYVADLSVRLGLYRRVSTLVDRAEIDGFAAELIDRFGPLPNEVNNLLEVIQIKRLCMQSSVEKIEAGPKGAVLTFKDNRFANPAALVSFIQRQSGAVKLRPDQKLVYLRVWERPQERVQGVHRLMQQIAQMAA